jgi:hypothetical protein
MNRRSVTMITAALLIAAGGWYYANTNGGQSKPLAEITEGAKEFAPSTIRLEIVIDGGFAYIPENPNRLNVAYLDTWKYTGKDDADPDTPESAVFCDVPQMGTKLEVKEGDGDVVVPGPAQTTFNVDYQIVSFPALDGSSATLAANHPRRTTSPFKPTNPAAASEWADLRYVSSLKAEHGARLDPWWRFAVSGFMALKGGTLIGQKPERYGGETFKFKGGENAPSPFEQALTDQTLYTVDVRAEQIEIELWSFDTDHEERIVVKPHGSSRTVRLHLTGVHKKTGDLAVGQELAEHCTFYQLFDPVPQPKSWLRPYLQAQPGATRVLVPHSPGFFCPGDWF